MAHHKRREHKQANMPTEADWRSEPWDFDIPYAYEHFAGKSLEQAIALFETNAIYYQEDLVHMPAPCLAFYIHAYIAYLLGESSQYDSDGASCFYGLVQLRHKAIQSFGPQTMQRTKDALAKLASHQLWFAADIDIYGDFREKSAEALALLEVIQGEG